MAEETTKEGTPTEPTGKYLTRSYLVQSFKDFWSSVKAYLDKALSKKVDIVDGKGLSSNDFTDTEKTKLEDIAENANNYSHPTASGNKHIPSGGTEGQILRWSSDGTAVWGDDTNTTYSEATENAAGLMSKEDKVKLEGIANNANNTTVDSTLSSTSENPVQNQVIYAALNRKVDKEDLLKPSGLQGFNYEKSSDGDIIIIPHNSTVHAKIHTENGETIEKFYVSFKDANGQNLNFNNFEKNSRKIVIPNPDGKGNLIASKIYEFYIESFEILGTGKYEPFILKVTRGSLDPKELILSILEIQ